MSYANCSNSIDNEVHDMRSFRDVRAIRKAARPLCDNDRGRTTGSENRQIICRR